MPDISKIAAACAARIFDRMEMCRGSAILKSDIEREVEMALRDHLASLVQPGPIYVDRGKRDIVEFITDERYVVDPALHARKCLEDYRASRPHDAPMTATEVRLDRAASAEAIRTAIVEDALRRLDHSVDPPRLASWKET